MSGDPKAQESHSALEDVFQNLGQQLPAYLNLLNQQVLPQAQAELGATKAITPEYNKLLLDQYQQYAPGLAKVGAETENINRLGAAKTDTDILKNYGQSMAESARAYDQTLNPEVARTRTLEADKLGSLLNSINLDNANPEAERLVNQENIRTGNIATPSATNTVGNALQFGNERLKRVNALGQALNTATGFLQSGQSSFNPMANALGRNSTGAGVNNFAGVVKPTDEVYQQGQAGLGASQSIKQQQSDINANRRDTLDKIMPDSVSL
jgi:hypothetical protein